MESKLLLFGLIVVPFAGIFMFLMLYGMAEGLNRTEDAKVFRKFLYFLCAFVFRVNYGINRIYIMKTLQECKDEVANKYGYKKWSEINFYSIDAIKETKPGEIYADELLPDEAAELHASQFKERIAELEKEIEDKNRMIAIITEVTQNSQLEVKRLHLVINELEKANEWISVKDASPKAGKLCVWVKYMDGKLYDHYISEVNNLANMLRWDYWTYFNPPKV